MRVTLTATAGASLWLKAMPMLFVVLWSTGFIGAKLGLPYVEPFTFLAIRFLIATGLLLAFALLSRAPWPTRPEQWGHIAVAGLLIHACHLGGVFSAIHNGLAAGVAALIMGLQPLLTAVVVGRLLGETVTLRQWLGLLLGLIGIAMVLYNRLSADSLTLAGISWATLGLVSLTFGTLYQKRFCAQMDLRSGGVIQYAAASLLLLPLAALTESMQVRWNTEMMIAMSWLVLVLSVGAVGLLLTLIRRGATARVASLFYLSPPFAVLFAYLLFGETLGMTALVGMVVVAAGVALVNMPGARA